MAQALIENRGPIEVGQDGRGWGGGAPVWDQNLLGGLRGPSKRDAAGPGAIGWPEGAALGGMFRLPLRAWRYSGGMLEGRCVSRHQGEPLAQGVQSRGRGSTSVSRRIRGRFRLSLGSVGRCRECESRPRGKVASRRNGLIG